MNKDGEAAGLLFIVHRSDFNVQRMALDLPKLRRLVAIDPDDPLSRFALGKKLFETHADDPSPAGAAALAEAAEHLTFANGRAPEHLATYHILGQVLIR